MKRKQILTFLLAGCLALVPAAITHAEETTEATAETPETIPETATETEATTEVTEQTTESPAETEAPTETEAPAETEAPIESETEAVSDGTVTTQEELEAAIAAAPEVEDLSTASPTIISISGTITISSTVNIPENKCIAITGTSDTALIQRADGMADQLFAVSGALYFTTDSAVTESALAIDGSVTDGTQVTGSLVSVDETGKLGITNSVTLKNNNTTAAGAAIAIAGTVYLAGGTITGNTSDCGAIYSTGTVNITGSPVITENYKTDGTASNIVLDGDGTIALKTVPANAIGFSHLAAYDGITVATAAESEALALLTYEGGSAYAYDPTTGTLTATAEDPSTETEEPSTEEPATEEPETEEPATEAPQTESETESESESETSSNNDNTDVPADLKVVCKAMEWTSATSIKLTLYSNLDASYYTAWAESNGATPSFDTSASGGAVAAETSFDVYFTDIPESTVPDLYIGIETSDGEMHTYIFRVSNYTSFLSSRPTSSTESSETEHEAVKAKVGDSTVTGLESPLAFYAGTYYSFTVTGAGTTNTNPGEGDTKWVPLYWSFYEEPTDAQKNSSWKIGFEEEISEATTGTMYVFFQKYTYTDGSWVAKDKIRSVAYNYYTAAISHETETESETEDVYASKYATETETETEDIYAKKYADEVSTGDETPIGVMAGVCFASLALAVGILAYRRKLSKDI